MRKLSVVLIILTLAFAASCTLSDPIHDEQPVDLTLEKFNYAEPFEVGVEILESEIEEHNSRASLGRLLFYDQRLSVNNSISCGSCHKQHLSFSDGLQFSKGEIGMETNRNSMALTNLAEHRSYFWQGQDEEFQDVILQPIFNHVEMGMRSEEALVDKVASINGYTELFDEVYPSDDLPESLHGVHIGKIENALASFVGSIYSEKSKYDEGLESEFENLTLSELRGKELFLGKAKCGNCHREGTFTATWRVATSIGLDKDDAEVFKVPTLRNIELTAPYMHDGRFETLEEVIEHYNTGIKETPSLDWTLLSSQSNGLGLNEEEVLDLVAFLKTLTDYSVTADSKFSDPF